MPPRVPFLNNLSLLDLPAGKSWRTLHFCVRFDEVIHEIRKLKTTERAAILRRLKEFEEKDGLLFLHEAADSMFRELDK